MADGVARSQHTTSSDPSLDWVRSKEMKCQKCHTTKDVRALESCGHQFCPRCIQVFTSQTLQCPVCNQFYCIAEEKTLGGKMTAYRRLDILLEGSTTPGAIFIAYDFPPGTQGPHHPRPGKPYKGVRASAYLPCDSDGFVCTRRLREAFIAGLTFILKTTGNGDYEVAWSDKIPHKLNPRGGRQNYGFPDPDYMKEITAALDKELYSRS